jgi:hypothetical protein
LDDWFVSVSPSVHLLQEETTLRFCVKPMELDPMFWAIVNLEENLSQPLSFRLTGAWTCQPPSLSIADVKEGGDPDEIAARFVGLADGLSGKVTDYTIADFVDLCMFGVPRPENFLACAVSALVLLGHRKEATRVCRQAVKDGHTGGYSAGKTFPNLAIDWLSSH